MMIGTSHFVSEDAARRYYDRQGIDARGVREKLLSGEIHIGPPQVEPGQVARIRLDEMRYYLCDEYS